jgi:hypothetical protein
VIGEPPFDAGGLQESVTLPLEALAESSVGAPGVVTKTNGVAERSFDCAPSPIPFTAATL